MLLPLAETIVISGGTILTILVIVLLIMLIIYLGNRLF